MNDTAPTAGTRTDPDFVFASPDGGPQVHAALAPSHPNGPLGPLAQLPGTWTGHGFNTIWRPHHGGKGTANTAFLADAANPPGGNAKASQVEAKFWIETVAGPSGEEDFLQLQYTQLVQLDFNGLRWPHVTVATLRKQ